MRVLITDPPITVPPVLLNTVQGGRFSSGSPAQKNPPWTGYSQIAVMDSFGLFFNPDRLVWASPRGMDPFLVRRLPAVRMLISCECRRVRPELHRWVTFLYLPCKSLSPTGIPFFLHPNLPLLRHSRPSSPPCSSGVDRQLPS